MTRMSRFRVWSYDTHVIAIADWLETLEIRIIAMTRVSYCT
jgi:hypothetical protein